MSEKQPIHGKRDNAHHDGRHSLTQRLQAFQAKFDEWRNGRTEAHEHGWTPDELKVIDRFYPQDAGFVGGFHPDANPYPEGMGTEIELFVAPGSLAEARKNLDELAKNDSA